MSSLKHIVITKLAIKWRFEETKLNWNDWLNYSIFLMDNYCRPSLKNQINQDFTLITLVDNSVNNFGNVLNNEIIIKIKKDKNSLYPVNNIVNNIDNYIQSLNNMYDKLIITRLDRDDMIKNNYLLNVKNKLKDKNNYYLDLNNLYVYNLNKNIFFKSKKYYNTFVSPFVSTVENIKSNMNYYILTEQHTKLNKLLNGHKDNSLYAMQIIHKYNLLNKVTGNKINNINTINEIKRQFNIQL